MICENHKCFMIGSGTAIFCPACDMEHEPHTTVPSELSARLYCVAYRGVVRYFETEKAVAGFLWGKNFSNCKVFRQVTGLPGEANEIEKYLKAI